MNQSKAPNPERRSNNALLCFCLGGALCIGAYLLGVGAVIGAALGGGDPAALVGSMIAVVALLLLGGAGLIMMIVGGVWMLVRVIADQRNEAEEKRYRDVER